MASNVARALIVAVAGLCAAATTRVPAHVTLSIIGTSDLHGEAFPRNGLGGLPLFAGYINNLRATRAADGGAVLVVDSGDTFQGGIESNLSEGALIVDAYNRIGYAAQAVGNHDFDFGAVDSAMARQSAGDLRGALKARAAQARYPFLAANLLDETTGQLVAWPNIRPSALVETAGIKVGFVGVMTIDALRSTLAANVQGLRIAPLAPAILAEASKLRANGAEIVIVVAHAGGRCDRFEQPSDLSSCDAESEIFQVARSLPPGLVNVIAAGHAHTGLAHEVNGIGIIEPFARGQWFARLDLVFDRHARLVTRMQPFAPRGVCAQQDATSGGCVPTTAAGVPVQYEGNVVTPDQAVVDAMAPAVARVRTLQATSLGVSLDVPIGRGGDADSPLGDLFADAMRHAVPGVDVAVINNATRGLRADLPAGHLTFGQLYNIFPFDNRIARITLTGAELRRWLTTEIQEGRRGSLGISGVRVSTSPLADSIRVDLVRSTGQPIGDDDRVIAVTIGGPSLSSGLASSHPTGGVGPTENTAVVREAVEDWLRRRAVATPRQ